jgi:hypothetical protein
MDAYSIVYFDILDRVAMRATTNLEFGRTLYSSGPFWKSFSSCLVERVPNQNMNGGRTRTESIMVLNHTSTEQLSKPPGGDADEL